MLDVTRREPPTVVLVPGMLCTAEVWAHLDLPFDSQRAVLTGRSIESMAIGVLSGTSGPLLLIGLSLGGIVAMAARRLAPHRVAGLALLSTTARPPRSEQRSAWQRDAAQTEEEFELMCEEQVDLLLRPCSNPGSRELAATMAREVGRPAYGRQLAAQQTRIDERPELASCRVPVLVIAARDDVLCPVLLHEEIASSAPSATLQVIEDCGHLSPIDQPALVSGALTAFHSSLDLTPTDAK